MTTTCSTCPTEVAAYRPRIFTRPLLAAVAANFAALTGFYLLLATAPGYATAVGAGGAGAGTATAVMMFATVAGEFAAPALLTRAGHRRVLAVALLLMAAALLTLSTTASLTALLVASAACGLGFGAVLVTAGTLIASLAPPERRGQTLGITGAVACLPAVVGLPLGVWLVAQVGTPPLFVAAALVVLCGSTVIGAIPAGVGGSGARHRDTGSAGLSALRLPALVFTSTTMAAGIVVAFLPLALGTASSGVAAVGLFAQSAAATGARLLAGRHSDRSGNSAKLLAPSLILCAVGVFALVLTSSPVVVVASMVVFGAGFGLAQNASLTTMLERVPRERYKTVSAVWNVAYDAGWGIGAAAFGVAVVHTGYPIAFALTGVVLLLALVPALRTRVR